MYKEVEHICISCRKSTSCPLWEQVCNIEEEFVRDAFVYDPEVQSICTTVSYCKLYEPGGVR